MNYLSTEPGLTMNLSNSQIDLSMSQITETLIDYDLDKSNEEISRHVRAFSFPYFQMPIGRYKGKEIELKLEDL